jgi:Asp-tRNA(Asn)/Glu-tRNA(Gln) amidotransferase A subunit family amidase
VDFAQVNCLHRQVMAAEAAEYHRLTFSERRADYSSRIAELVQEGLELPAPDYAGAKKQQPVLRHALLHCFGEYDALLTPATPTAAPGLEATGDPKFNSPWSYLGLPTVSMPCDLTTGSLPVGLQLVGRPFEEGPLLAVADWCEGVRESGHLAPG